MDKLIINMNNVSLDPVIEYSIDDYYRDSQRFRMWVFAFPEFARLRVLVDEFIHEFLEIEELHQMSCKIQLELNKFIHDRVN